MLCNILITQMCFNFVHTYGCYVCKCHHVMLSTKQEHFCQELILILTRKAGAPSPGGHGILKTPSAGSLQDSRSGFLVAEQRIFKLAEVFAKQFLK